MRTLLPSFDSLVATEMETVAEMGMEMEMEMEMGMASMMVLGIAALLLRGLNVGLRHHLKWVDKLGIVTIQ